MTEQAKPLQAYWVGDCDLWAAEDEAQAVALANAIAADPASYTLDDVCPAGPDVLDVRLASDEGKEVWTLRGLLQAQTEPGYLAGIEP